MIINDTESSISATAVSWVLKLLQWMDPNLHSNMSGNGWNIKLGGNTEILLGLKGNGDRSTDFDFTPQKLVEVELI